MEYIAKILESMQTYGVGIMTLVTWVTSVVLNIFGPDLQSLVKNYLKKTEQNTPSMERESKSGQTKFGNESLRALEAAVRYMTYVNWIAIALLIVAVFTFPVPYSRLSMFTILACLLLVIETAIAKRQRAFESIIYLVMIMGKMSDNVAKLADVADGHTRLWERFVIEKEQGAAKTSQLKAIAHADKPLE